MVCHRSQIPTVHSEPKPRGRSIAMITELAATSHAERQPFVWSLMGQDAGQPLKEIIIRKEAERRTGGEFWCGLGTPLGDRVESVASLNKAPLPVLFSKLGAKKTKQGSPSQNVYVWERWRSIRKGRSGTYGHGSIPKHVLVLGGNP